MRTVILILAVLALSACGDGSRSTRVDTPKGPVLIIEPVEPAPESPIDSAPETLPDVGSLEPSIEPEPESVDVPSVEAPQGPEIVDTPIVETPPSEQTPEPVEPEIVTYPSEPETPIVDVPEVDDCLKRHKKKDKCLIVELPGNGQGNGLKRDK